MISIAGYVADAAPPTDGSEWWVYFPWGDGPNGPGLWKQASYETYAHYLQAMENNPAAWEGIKLARREA